MRSAHVTLWCAHTVWERVAGQKHSKETCIAKSHMCLEATLLQGLPEGGADQGIQSGPHLPEQRMGNAVHEAVWANAYPLTVVQQVSSLADTILLYAKRISTTYTCR